MKTSLSVLLVAALSYSVLPAAFAAPSASPYTQALWVFPGDAHANPVTDASARQTLIANSAASYVTALYVSVYAYPENSAGRRMYDEAAIADLITRAHGKGMSVHAAYGAPDWPSLGCDASSFPQQRMQEVIAYNAAHPTAKSTASCWTSNRRSRRATRIFRRCSRSTNASTTRSLRQA